MVNKSRNFENPEKRSIFYSINIVLPTRFNSSPRIKKTLRWFLQTFTSRFIELSSRDRRVTSAYSSNYQRKSSRFRRIDVSDVSTDHFIRTVQTEHRTAKKGMSLNRLRLKSIRDDLRWCKSRIKINHIKIINCKEIVTYYNPWATS